VVTCLQQGEDCLQMVQLMPLHPKIPSFLPYLNPDWFYLSGIDLPTYPGCHRQEAVKWA